MPDSSVVFSAQVDFKRSLEWAVRTSPGTSTPPLVRVWVPLMVGKSIDLGGGERTQSDEPHHPENQPREPNSPYLVVVLGPTRMSNRISSLCLLVPLSENGALG